MTTYTYKTFDLSTSYTVRSDMSVDTKRSSSVDVKFTTVSYEDEESDRPILEESKNKKEGKYLVRVIYLISNWNKNRGYIKYN